ncbi:MAG: lysylphosphatidylglycerol synthase transmembrane domain-containing protein [Vicinamibacterales bacterium]
MSSWVLRAAVSVTVAAVLLMFIPLDAVLEALVRVSLWTWGVSLAIFFAGHYLNALKLRLLLGPHSISVSTCVQAQYAGLAANLSLPGVAGGDLVRGAYLVPTLGTRRVALASIADRVVDTLTLLLLAAVALPIAGMPPAIAGIVRTSGWWLVLVALGALLVTAAVVRFRKHAALLQKLVQIWVDVTARPSALAGAAAISLLVQAAFVMTNVWLARQVGVATTMAAWFVAWPLSKLIAILPISLGGIGVREAALVSLMAPYGAAREAVLASGILWQTVLTVSGLAGLLVTQLLRKSTPAPRAHTLP